MKHNHFLGLSISITCLEPTKAFRQLDSQFRLQRSKVDEFIVSMSEFFDYPGGLVASLRSLEDLGTLGLQQHGQQYGQTDTFLKLLLRMETLQDRVIEILLGKMLLLAGADERIHQSHTRSDNERLTIQIFNHIRWCELLCSPERVVQTLLESVQVNNS